MSQAFWDYDSWLEINRERANSWCSSDDERWQMYERERQEYEAT
jgi:hypothetical protein